MAARYFINGLVDSNWSSITNWSTTSGGVGGSAVPTAADDVNFDANSPNCTVNTSARVALTLNFTGYTNTITMDQQISVSGSVTLVAAMTIAGTGALLVIATSTLTSNGKTWPNTFGLRGTATHTLADAWTVSVFLYGASTLTTGVNGFTITVLTNLDLSAGSTNVLIGTTEIIMTGTGNIVNFTSTGSLRNPLTINTAGTITFPTGTFRYNTGPLKYVAGTVIASGTDLNCVLATTFDTAGTAMVFASLTIISLTYTLSSDLRITGLFTINGVAATTVNGFTLYIGGGISIPSAASSQVLGTTVFRLTGTGVLSAPSLTSGKIVSPITIDAGAGTITITNPFTFNLALLTYYSGNVTFNNAWTTGGAAGMLSIPNMAGT